MLGLRLGFSSSITLRPPTFGRSKHHLHLAQRAIPNVINCSKSSTDALKKADMKLRKVVKEELKSCVVQKPQVPKDFPFEVDDVPKRPCFRLKLNRRDEAEREKFNVLAFLPEDYYLDTVDTDEEEPPTYIVMEAYIRKEDGERLIIYWVADPDPDLCFADAISVNGVELEEEEVKRFDWRGTLRARGIDDRILTEFAIDYLKFRTDRKRWLTLKKFEEFINFKVKDSKVYTTPWGETLAPHSKEWNPWSPYGCFCGIL